MADAELLALLQEYQATPDKPLTASDTALGLSRSWLQGPTFGFADELEAAAASNAGMVGSSLLGALPGGIGVPWQQLMKATGWDNASTGNTYKQELNQIRADQAKFKEQIPYLGTGLEIASSVVSPNIITGLGNTLLKGGSKILNTIVRKPETVGTILKTAPVQGAIQGAGMAEGNENTLQSMGTGGAVGFAGSALSSTVGKVLEKTGLNANRFKLSAFGIGQADIQKQVKKLGPAGVAEMADDLPIVKAINKYERVGVISAANDVLDNLKNIVSTQDQLGNELSTLLQEADAVVPGMKGFQTKATDRFINSLSGTARNEALEAAAQEYVALTGQMTNGSLDDLQRLKVGLNYKFDQNPYKEDIIKALRSDLRQEIEDRVNIAAKQKLIDPNKLGYVKKLNQEWGKLAELGETFARGVGRKYGGNAVEDVISSMRTSGGVGNLNIASAASGNIIPAAIGAVLTAGRGPEALSALGNITREWSPMLQAIGKTLPEMITGKSTVQALSPFIIKNQQVAPQEEAQAAPPIDDELKDMLRNYFSNKQRSDNTMPASPNLLNAIIKAESGGKANAVSPAGAQGLMQLMPATFNEWAKKIGIEKPNIKDPEQNKAVGTAYFNFLLDKYGQDEKLALAAYNYGLGNVDKLIKRHGYNFDKIEKFLPKETRAYVPRVLNFAYA